MSDRRRPGFWAAALFALGLWLGLAPLAPAQTTGPERQVDESGSLLPRPKEVPATPTGPVNGKAAVAGEVAPKADGRRVDFKVWERMASRAEAMLLNATASTVALEHLRAQLVEWREALLGAQTANQARITTIQDQIAALGPAPAEGASEADAIASRRAELATQLRELEAPSLAAVEAYRRADGLIGEIDRELRERQADALLKVWPSPVNPANWPEAAVALSDVGFQLYDEAQTGLADPRKRTDALASLPAVVVFLILALVLLRYGHRWIERLVMYLQERSSTRWRRIWAFLTSLGALIVPMVGVLLLSMALVLTGLLGPLLEELVYSFSDTIWPLVLAAWLGRRLFPIGNQPGPLNLGSERRAESRYALGLLGLLQGIKASIDMVVAPRGYSDGALAVLIYPLIVVTALILFRVGQLLQSHVRAEEARAEGSGAAYSLWLMGLVARAVKIIAAIAPVLGAFGYIPAASVAVFASVASLALIGLVVILQELVADTVAAFSGSDDTSVREGLLPVLANFLLVVLALPAFALIWGVRSDDLLELWTRFQEGFSIGSTRISPTNFLFLVVVFSIGFALTRALQRALRASILPRTSLDRGGQTAVVSGAGYLGIFLSSLVAINAAGIDLSGLAIVAGALSVGIGFGLQTIVSNFVSGIILLIERPVSEGDWIEVGTTQGIVKSISVRSTRIQTFDRSDVIVPNSDLITGRVTNWTRFNQTGRLIVPVAVPFTEDSRKVETILREIAEAQPLAILTPPPVVAMMGFGPEVMNFEIRVILRDVNFQLQVRSEINHQIAERFAAEGVRLSNAHRDLYTRRAEQDLAERELEEETRANRAAIAAAFGVEETAAPRPARSRPTKPRAKAGAGGAGQPKPPRGAEDPTG